MIDAAIDAGVTFFDTADIYGASAGSARRSWARRSKGRRDEIVLATKFGMDMAGTNGPDWGAAARAGTSASRSRHRSRRLQTDWIDLYQLHDARPGHADRGDARRARRSHRARARCATSATRTSPAGRSPRREFTARPRAGIPVHLGAERVQPAAREAEREVLPAVERVRARLPAVLPAAQRPAHRQVHAATAGPPTAASWRPRRTCWRTRRGMRIEALPGVLRRARRSRCSRRPSAGCWPSRASRA